MYFSIFSRWCRYAETCKIPANSCQVVSQAGFVILRLRTTLLENCPLRSILRCRSKLWRAQDSPSIWMPSVWVKNLRPMAYRNQTLSFLEPRPWTLSFLDPLPFHSWILGHGCRRPPLFILSLPPPGRVIGQQKRRCISLCHIVISGSKCFTVVWLYSRLQHCIFFLFTHFLFTLLRTKANEEALPNREQPFAAELDKIRIKLQSRFPWAASLQKKMEKQPEGVNDLLAQAGGAKGGGTGAIATQHRISFANDDLQNAIANEQ